MKKSNLTNWLLTIQIFFCCLMIFSPIANAQTEKSFVTVENLHQDWIVFDNKNNEFSPFIEDIFSPPYLHFKLSLNKYEDYYLSLSVPGKTAIYIENRIVNFTEDAKTYYYSIDSLKNIYAKDETLISVFSENNLSQRMQSSILDFNPKRGFDIKEAAFDSVIRSQNKLKDFNVLSILIVLMIGTIVRTSQNNVFGEYFDLSKTISLKSKSEVLYSISLLSFQNLSFLFLYGVVLGFSLCNLMLLVNPSLLWNIGFTGTIDFVLFASLASIFFMGLIILKYPLIHFFSNIFQFKKAKQVHYYEYLRLTLFISVVFLFGSVFNNFSDGIFLSDNRKLIIGLVMILLIGRSFLVFLKLNSLQSFRKLHLFSYLCSTEIIPLIIILKIFKVYIGVF